MMRKASLIGDNMGLNHLNEKCKKERMGEKNINYQGDEMIIVEFKDCKNIWVEFQDDYHAKVHAQYGNFKEGSIKNPFHPGKFGQITGNKYKTKENGKNTKEYRLWFLILYRVFNTNLNKNKCYEHVAICNEWYYYPNFYEWVIQQPNYDKWKNNPHWVIDKDILSDPNNKIYSPQTCCLVPEYINNVIVTKKRSSVSNGVTKYNNGYRIKKSLDGKKYFKCLEDATEAYRKYKKNTIIEAANKAYENNDITLHFAPGSGRHMQLRRGAMKNYCLMKLFEGE